MSGAGKPRLPRVSVIIAAHDAAKFINTAIQSALTQSGVEVEVIVADDASRDETVTLVTRIAAGDARVSLARLSVNLGPAGARNRALDAATGDWIAVLDADDTMAEGRLATLCAAARDTGAQIVLDDFVSVDREGRALGDVGLSQVRGAGELTLNDWLRLNAFERSEVSFGYAKPLISRAWLVSSGLRYDETLRNGEDFHIVLGALAKGARVYFTAQPGYRYTRREGSVSRKANATHMLALLNADIQVMDRLTDAQSRTAGALFARRHRNLARLMTTEEVLGALKARQPLRAAQCIARRPDAFGRVIAHLGEALHKRIQNGG